MNIQSTYIPTNSVIAGSLAPLINELNISRRNSSAYPKGHPVVTASFVKVLGIYEDLLSKHEEIILGVTSDALMVNGAVLEKSNIVYRNFSRALFDRGIGALLFHRGLTAEELNNFIVILGIKREIIHKHGGIEQVWTKARITSMTIRPIRYDLFQTTDETPPPDRQTEGLWDRFVREITRGEHSESSDSASLDPDILSEIFSMQLADGRISTEMIRIAIGDFLAASDVISTSEPASGGPHRKLAEFISNLAPALRRQFINSSFADLTQDQQTGAEHILANLSDKAILETLEDINQNRLSVSSTIFGLLQRLGKNAPLSSDCSEDLKEDDDLSRKLKTIFREHASEEFIPDGYRKKLNHIMESGLIPNLSLEDAASLQSTVEHRAIESSIGQILMNLVRGGIETPEERDLLLRNLSDMFGFFLQIGDYGQLHTLIDQLADDTFPDEIRLRLRDEYCQREFLEEILDGLSIWGKPRYGDIRSLIHKIGGHFIETILDRLSEEKNMSLRRFYIDCLIEMGQVTREPIINRLSDKRWYFLRNLLVILSAQNDPSVALSIRPLLRNEDPRLRHEVLKTLVQFRDPLAEKQVLDNLDSQNQELQNAAVQLAERCTSPAIADKLGILVSQGGFSQSECDRKSAIVYALGEIGRAEVLPVLARILSSRSLLNSRQLTRLKGDIIRSLTKYPPGVSVPVLKHIAGGSGEVARLAAETLQIVSRKKS